MTTNPSPHAHPPNRQTLHVVIGLLAGVAVGECLNLAFGGEATAANLLP